MVSSRNFCFEIEVFLVKKGPYHISDSKDRQKQRQIGSMTKKINFFPKKRRSKILVRESVFRPPKLGAKSSSMATRNNHIIYMCNQCYGMLHSFIDDRFFCMVHGFSWPSLVPPHMVKVQGWDPSIHCLHVSIWSPLTACA